MSDYLKGVEDTIAALQGIKKTKAKAAIRKGTRAGSKVIQSAAKSLAPRRTGLLQQSLKVRSLPRSRTWTGVVVVLADPVFYGGFSELGTKRQPALHWMQKAAQQVREQALSTALDVIQGEILK